MDKYEEMMIDLLQSMSDADGEPVFIAYGNKRITIGDDTIPDGSDFTHRDLQNWIYVVELLFERGFVNYSSGPHGSLYTISALGYDYLDENSE